MRCLHIPHAYPPVVGGAELICQRVSESLVRRGHEVRVVTANVGAVQGYYQYGVHAVGPKRENRAGVDVRRIDYIGIVYRLAGALGSAGSDGPTRRLQGYAMAVVRRLFNRRVAGQIAGYRPDVIMTMPHLVVNVSAVLEANRSLRYPLVMVPMLHEHDPNWSVAAMAQALRGAGAVIALTRHEADRLKTAYEVPAGNTFVASVGIDPPADCGSPDRRPRVLFLGRKALSKGIIELIDAMELVWDEYPQAELILAGVRVPETAQIDARIRRLAPAKRARISDVEPVLNARKRELVASSRCLVLPSRIESFGMVLLDAWREAVPVVTWDLPVFRDIVDDERDGLLVEAGSVEQLAQAIKRLLADYDTAAALGAAGYRKAKRDYDWEHVASTYLDAYAFAVNACRRPDKRPNVR